MTISNAAALNSVQIRVRSTATVLDVKRAIIRAASGTFVPDSIVIKSVRHVNTSSFSGSLPLVDGATISAHAAPDNGAPFTLSVKFKVYPHKTVYLLAGRKDKAEALLWRLYRDHGVPPSTVELWTGLESSGDGWETGNLLNPDDHLSRARTDLSDDNTPLEIEVHSASAKKKHTSKHLSRLEAVKQLFHAFISRTEAYDLPHHVGLVLFGKTAVI